MKIKVNFYCMSVTGAVKVNILATCLAGKTKILQVLQDTHFSELRHGFCDKKSLVDDITEADNTIP